MVRRPGKLGQCLLCFVGAAFRAAFRQPHWAGDQGRLAAGREACLLLRLRTRGRLRLRLRLLLQRGQDDGLHEGWQE